MQLASVVQVQRDWWRVHHFSIEFLSACFPQIKTLIWEGGKEHWQSYQLLVGSPLTCEKVSGNVENEVHVIVADHDSMKAI